MEERNSFIFFQNLREIICFFDEIFDLILVKFSLDKNRNCCISHKEDCIFGRKKCLEGKAENFNEFCQSLEQISRTL